MTGNRLIDTRVPAAITPGTITPAAITPVAVTLAVVALCTALAMAAPAHAQDMGATLGDSLGSWRIGTLGSPVGDARGTDRIAGYATFSGSKTRVGGSLLPWIEPYATVKSWLGSEPAADGGRHGAGGILIDVPMGSLIFTPSLGASYVTGGARDSNTAMEVRSQFEVGYEFANKSRFTLGYSRVSGNSSAVQTQQSANVFGLSYRLPFGSLTDQ
jgi:hypothetical protein